MTRRCWIPLGPACVRFKRGGRVLSGRFNAIAVDPRDPTGGTVVAGAAGGGAWRTTDSGVTWSVLGSDLKMDRHAIDRRLTDLSISAIAFHKHADGRTFLALGTGDTRNVGGQPGGGAIVSDDGGNTWRPKAREDSLVPDKQQHTDEFYKEGVTTLVADTTVTLPDGSPEFVAGTQLGLYRSHDRGQRGWSRIAGGIYTSLAVSDGRVLAARARDGGGNEGVYDVATGRLGATVLPATGTRGRVFLAVARSNTKVVYAAFAKRFSDEFPELFRSPDGGATWSALSKPTWGPPSSADERMWIAVHPGDPNRVYVYDGHKLFHSFDGGATAKSWDDIDDDLGADFEGFHPVGLAASTVAPFRTWIATTHGVYVSLNEGSRPAPTPDPNNPEDEDGPLDQKTTWEPRIRSLAALQIHEFAQHPTERGVIFGAAPGHGLVGYQAHPLWNLLRGKSNLLEDLPIVGVAIDPNEPTTWYATTLDPSHRVIQSKDSGVTWRAIQAGLGSGDRDWRRVGDQIVREPCPLAIDPSSKGIVYLGTDVLYRRDDSDPDAGWTPIPATNMGPLSALAVAPSNPNVIYAGRKDGMLLRMEGLATGAFKTDTVQLGVWVFVRNDAGETVLSRTTGEPIKSFVRATGISSIAVEADDANSGYVGIGYPALAVRGSARTGAPPRLYGFGYDFEPADASAGTPARTSWIGGPIPIEFLPEVRAAWGIAGLPKHVAVRKVLTHPDPRDRRVYVATDIGVFVSDPEILSDRKWRDLSDNLPRVPVSDMAFFPAGPPSTGDSAPPRVLRVATFGRGVWERVLEEPAGACEGFDIHLRAKTLDPGTAPLPGPNFDFFAGEALEFPAGWEKAPDLKIDRPKIQKPKSNWGYIPRDDPNAVADYIGFELLRRNEAKASEQAHVYLQVHNAGPSVAKVKARVLYTPVPKLANGEFAAPRPVPLPIPQEVFGTILATAKWQPIGATQQVDVRPAEPAVLRWSTWKPPSDTSERIYLAAFVSADGEPLHVTMVPPEYVARHDKRVFVTTVDVLRPARGRFRWWMVAIPVGIIGGALLLDAFDVEDLDLGLI